MNIPYTNSAARLKMLIEIAIEDHKLARAEMDEIFNVAGADSHIDKHELALLDQLNQMIDLYHNCAIHSGESSSVMNIS